MIDPRALDLIKRWEGLRLKRYYCAAGVATIGYGSTHWWDGKPIPVGATLADEDEAERLMEQELRPTEMRVRTAAKGGSEAQIGALVSFAYNLGVGALKGSTLLKKHNAGDYEGAAEQFVRWIHAGGKKLPGLVARRADERKLYEEA